MLQGAIFDMDGVLLDNLNFHLAAWRQLGRELGRSLTDEEIRSVFGQRNFEMLTSLIGLHFHEEEASRHAERKEELYRSMIRPKLQQTAVPGVLGFLRTLQREGLRIALATSGPVENADLVLRGFAITDVFSAVITGVDVTESKPNPEVFLLAAKRLGLAPMECAVFEDSIAGVQAALRAQCLCIGVSTTHNRLELDNLGTHHIITNFKALSLDMLRQIYRTHEATLSRRPDPSRNDFENSRRSREELRQRPRRNQKHGFTGERKSSPKSRPRGTRGKIRRPRD